MHYTTGFRIALKALGRHKLRTFLTMLGMIIGVGAVMTMVALGNGAQAAVESDVKSAGTNLVYVNAGNYTRGGDELRVAAGRGGGNNAHTRRCRGDCATGERRHAPRAGRFRSRADAGSRRPLFRPCDRHRAGVRAHARVAIQVGRDVHRA
jgi:hypothetical protein